MIECEYCDEEFEDETELHIHWGEEHEDEITSHEKEKVKKAKREKDKRSQQKKAKMKEYRNYALLGVILVGLIGGGYMLMPDEPLFNSSGNVGPAGSAHYHADFSVVINGEEVDFSQPQYQVVSQKAHVEGGNGDVVHSHATGATFGFFMRTLGFDYNETYISTPSNEYYENGKEVRMFVNTETDWREIEPTDFKFNTGDQILLTYGNYTEEEISDFQSRVTSQSENL